MLQPSTMHGKPSRSRPRSFVQSAATVQPAEAAIAKLPAGPDADALTQRLDVVQAIVGAQDLLAGITSRDLTDQAAIDGVIVDLAEARTIIDQLPEDHCGPCRRHALDRHRQLEKRTDGDADEMPAG